MKMIDLVKKLTRFYMNEVVRLYRVLVFIVSYQDPRFTSWLWPSIQVILRIKLNMSTVFHPQTNG
jgi:hypothetical protein